jgi:hypothetical protein
MYIAGHAALADFSENAVRVAVDAIKCRSIEGGAESVSALMPGQIMETFVRVFGQH